MDLCPYGCQVYNPVTPSLSFFSSLRCFICLWLLQGSYGSVSWRSCDIFSSRIRPLSHKFYILVVICLLRNLQSPSEIYNYSLVTKLLPNLINSLGPLCILLKGHMSRYIINEALGILKVHIYKSNYRSLSVPLYLFARVIILKVHIPPFIPSMKL